MPTLHWIGKDKVVNHHHEVPFRVLTHAAQHRAPDGAPPNTTDNRIIHGDNLAALKSLLPEYEGRIQCVYIDPPYNTGNEGWAYNDNVNDPKLKAWLGTVVGKEGEDLSRHDKWLCMIYPRLTLLRQLMHESAVICISIDENEYHYLKLVMDEIFGRHCYLGTFVWKTRNTDNRVKSKLSVDHEQVLVYSRTREKSIFGRFIDRSDFRNPDDDPRGVYVTDPLTGKATAEDRPNLHYDIVNEETGDVYEPDLARGWITDKLGYERLLADNRIWWPPNPATGKPRKKRFLFETAARMPVSSFWADTRGQTGSDELDKIMGKRVFAFPKSVEFMTRLLDVACGPDAIILDSFAGSGTTAHAALALNARDGGSRRFILIETLDYAETLTAERVRRAIDGYGSGDSAVPPLGGGFDFYATGEPIFSSDGELNDDVGIDAIRNYMAYAEGIPPEYRVPQDNPYSPHLLGLNLETAWLFNYAPDEATCLNLDYLSTLSFGDKKPATAIIYADRCFLSKDFMQANGLIFKKIPRDVTRF